MEKQRQNQICVIGKVFKNYRKVTETDDNGNKITCRYLDYDLPDEARISVILRESKYGTIPMLAFKNFMFCDVKPEIKALFKDEPEPTMDRHAPHVLSVLYDLQCNNYMSICKELIQQYVTCPFGVQEFNMAEDEFNDIMSKFNAYITKED